MIIKRKNHYDIILVIMSSILPLANGEQRTADSFEVGLINITLNLLIGAFQQHHHKERFIPEILSSTQITSIDLPVPGLWVQDWTALTLYTYQCQGYGFRTGRPWPCTLTSATAMGSGLDGLDPVHLPVPPLWVQDWTALTLYTYQCHGYGFRTGRPWPCTLTSATAMGSGLDGLDPVHLPVPGLWVLDWMTLTLYTYQCHGYWFWTWWPWPCTSLTAFLLRSLRFFGGQHHFRYVHPFLWNPLIQPFIDWKLKSKKGFIIAEYECKIWSPYLLWCKSYDQN